MAKANRAAFPQKQPIRRKRSQPLDPALSNPALLRAVEQAGGQSALARKINAVLRRLGREKEATLRQQHIYSWLHVHRRVPPALVIPVELAVGQQVTRKELAPDVYPD